MTDLAKGTTEGTTLTTAEAASLLGVTHNGLRQLARRRLVKRHALDPVTMEALWLKEDVERMRPYWRHGQGRRAKARRK